MNLRTFPEKAILNKPEPPTLKQQTTKRPAPFIIKSEPLTLKQQTTKQLYPIIYKPEPPTLKQQPKRPAPLINKPKPTPYTFTSKRALQPDIHRPPTQPISISPSTSPNSILLTAYNPMSTVASEIEAPIPPLQPIENQPKCPANHSYLSSGPSNQPNSDPANIKKPKSKKFKFIPEKIRKQFKKYFGKRSTKYENN